jgi:hypothetical protein
MSNIKYTGTNIAAAVLILFYFFPWVNAIMLSMSGFTLTSNGISPGLMAYFISGFTRFFLILAVLVPLSGAVILYQNITGNKRFEKFYKPAHIVPAIYLIVGIIGLYFKMKPDAPALSGREDEMFQGMSTSMSDMAPGAFDILSFGVYISLIAAVYILLVSMGKIKDKEYYKPAAAVKVDTTEKIDTAEKKDNII